MASNEELLAACDSLLDLEKHREIHGYHLDHAYVLARYVRESLAGEGEAITEEWCRQLLGKENTGRLYQCGEWIPEIRGIDQWVRLRKETTRRQLLSLLSALGIETTS